MHVRHQGILGENQGLPLGRCQYSSIIGQPESRAVLFRQRRKIMSYEVKFALVNCLPPYQGLAADDFRQLVEYAVHKSRLAVIEKGFRHINIFINDH